MAELQGKPKGARRRDCSSCWFSGMEPVTSDPHGRIRWVCCVSGSPTRPRDCCARWVPDKGHAPAQADFEAARQGPRYDEKDRCPTCGHQYPRGS